MKITACLFFLLGLCGGQAEEDHRRRLIINRRIRPDRVMHVNGVHDVHDHDKHDTPISPDSDEHKHQEIIERPCPNFDVGCIRKFFVHHSKCTPVYGSAPDPFHMKKILVKIPHANITVDIYDAQVTGLSSGHITEFYINKAKDLLVLGVEFNKIIGWCPKTVMSYHRKNKEPVEVEDFSVFETKDLSLTLTVQHINDLNLAEAHVYSYLPDANPQLILGAGLEDISHPDLSKQNLIWKDNIALTAREAYITHGPNFMAAFLQSIICDFRHENKNKQSGTV